MQNKVPWDKYLGEQTAREAKILDSKSTGWRDHPVGEVHYELAKGESRGCLPYLHQWEQDAGDESDDKVAAQNFSEPIVAGSVWRTARWSRWCGRISLRPDSSRPRRKSLALDWGAWQQILCDPQLFPTLCRFQIRHEDFRQRIAVEDEDITRYRNPWSFWILRKVSRQEISSLNLFDTSLSPAKGRFSTFLWSIGPNVFEVIWPP